MSTPTMSLREAAERLGVHYMTAYRYVRTGRLPAARDGAEWRVQVADVERLRAGDESPPEARGSRAAARARLEARLLAGDEAGAWTVVENALAAGMPPTDAHLVLLVPALRSIGDRWEAGDLAIADEHRASVIAQRLVGRLGPRFARRGRKRGTVVLGAIAGDGHALPGAILADLLRDAGFDVVDLGANTPAESFVATAQGASRLVAVVVGAITAGHDQAVRHAVSRLRRSGVGAPILVGGPAIVDASHAESLGADDWTGHDGVSAVAAVEAALERRD